MFENLTLEHATKFDDLLKSRHSVRAFNTTPLKKELIEQIVQAGLIAPYAAIPAAGKNDFRKVFVISSLSNEMEIITKIVNEKLPAFAIELENKYGSIAYVNVIKQASSASFKAILGNAPYLIIAAEHIGIPANSKESISYCMQNMWLKATSLKIGFRLIALIDQLKLEKDSVFCELLDIQKEAYSISASAIGFPAEDFIPKQVCYPNFEMSVKWFD